MTNRSINQSGDQTDELIIKPPEIYSFKEQMQSSNSVNLFSNVGGHGQFCQKFTV